MRKISSLTLLIAFLPLTAHAQNLYPKKDLAFAQVAAGGGYETILNLSNRGSATYSGVLSLYHQTPTGPQPWSPLVNGNQISNGTFNITLRAGVSNTYHITLAGDTDAGFAVIEPSDQAQNNFVEGNLTYYVSSGTTRVDSVGVQPSSEFYLTAIPFEDFSTLAMALANVNKTDATAKLIVYNETNTVLASKDQPLSPNGHTAVYLWQLFAGVNVTKGRLEIRSSLPIIGTILTDIGGQLSSLPLLPAVKAYTFTSGSIGGSTFRGEISFWLDGPFVQGYVRVLTVDGVPESSVDTIPLSGSFVNGVLQATTSGNPDPEQLLTYIIISPYSLSQASVQGSFTVWMAATKTSLGTGTLTMTAIN